MESCKITYRIEKTAEGTYFGIPFSVPEGVEAITVAYRYPREARGCASPNIVDIGLADSEGRFMGWSGSNRSEITVGEHDGTPGYLMEPVRAGQWQILAGAYHICPEGVPVEYTIAFRPKAPGWLFGDLHMHSDASDGQYDIPTLAKMAKKRGLDFISVTNHNNFAENLHLPKVAGVTLIPGVEWTHYKGHINFFGLGQPFENSFIANSEADMQALLAQVRSRGAVVSVNHPRCDMCPCLWQDDSRFDMVEIWNGPMRPTNLRGIAYWTQLLTQGRHIAAVGGSDFHRSRQPARMGNPVTAVYSDSRAPQDILQAVREGRSYVTDHAGGVRLSLRCGACGMGDTVPADAPHTVQFGAEHLPRRAHLLLIGPKGSVLADSALHGPNDAEMAPGISFVYLMAAVRRAGIWWPLAVSNPIYFQA